MNSALISLLLVWKGPMIVFDDRPAIGVPPEALAQKPGASRNKELLKTFHDMTDGTMKAVRIRYFNKATWATKEEACAYVAGFLSDKSSAVFDFQIWSQSVGRPEIESIIEFSDDSLKKLRAEKKPCHSEGLLLLWNTEACFRDATGRWWFVNVFNHFHNSHPRGNRRLAKTPTSTSGPILPVGKWKVEFANGVAETCAIRDRGTAYVIEPLRTSIGSASVESGSFMLRFEDDRVERWTPVGTRMVVEHWFPGSQFGKAKPVLGVADRA